MWTDVLIYLGITAVVMGGLAFGTFYKSPDKLDETNAKERYRVGEELRNNK